jgi:hypothetical protein
MGDDSRRTYRIRDFSALTGDSVRALHLPRRKPSTNPTRMS